MAYDWSEHAPQLWRSEVASRILPILLQRAEDGRTITYTELAKGLQRRNGGWSRTPKQSATR